MNPWPLLLAVCLVAYSIYIVYGLFWLRAYSAKRRLYVLLLLKYLGICLCFLVLNLGVAHGTQRLVATIVAIVLWYFPDLMPGRVKMVVLRRIGGLPG